MPINPITVTRIKTVSLMGHSNGDGWGATERLFSAYPYLQPGTSNPASDPIKAFWKNIYVATSALPYPGVNHTPVASDVSDVQWLEMTVANTAEPTDDHPHASPYQYPNNQGACYPHYYFNAYSTTGALDLHITPNDASSSAIGVRHGVELPLMWAWRHYWNEQVGLVKMAFSSSYMMSRESGAEAGEWLDVFSSSHYTPLDPLYVRSAIYCKPAVTPLDSNYRGDPYNFHAWWTPSDDFDWQPQTERLYRKWYNRLVGAAAALPTGTKLDIQLVVPWFGDNDSLTIDRSGLESGFKNVWLSLIKRIRADLVANDWTTLNHDEIPIVIPKVHYAYSGPSNSPTFSSQNFCNAVLAQIALDDPFVKIVDSHTWNTMTQDGYSLYGIEASSHIGTSGYVQAAADIMNAWQSMRQVEYDALRQDETITVSTAMDRVRLYYSKSRSNTDQTDEIVMLHLNSAMNHVFNHVGDNAWWLRRRMQLQIQAGPTTVFSLPDFVHRLLIIEDRSDPTYPLEFEQIGHGDGGKLQIRMKERASGTYWCSLITTPKELTRLDQIIPAPKNVTEWIIVEACRRLAAASSNAALMGHFAGEAMQLQSDALRNMGATQRSKRDAMRTQRRRPNFRYGSNGRSRWASDY